MKKNQIERYHEGQLWLLVDGTFLLITAVDPQSRLKSTGAHRRIEGKRGGPSTSKDAFNPNYRIIKDTLSGGKPIAVDMSNGINYTIDEFHVLTARFIGIVSSDTYR